MSKKLKYTVEVLAGSHVHGEVLLSAGDKFQSDDGDWAKIHGKDKFAVAENFVAALDAPVVEAPVEEPEVVAPDGKVVKKASTK